MEVFERVFFLGRIVGISCYIVRELVFEIYLCA